MAYTANFGNASPGEALRIGWPASVRSTTAATSQAQQAAALSRLTGNMKPAAPASATVRAYLAPSSTTQQIPSVPARFGKFAPPAFANAKPNPTAMLNRLRVLPQKRVAELEKRSTAQARILAAGRSNLVASKVR